MKLIRKYKDGKLTTADVRTLNHIVIGLMVLVAITSILWSITLHVISGDFFNNNVIGAKIVFRERDLEQMSERAKYIHNLELEQLFNSTYAQLTDANRNSNPLDPEKHVMLPDIEHNQNATTTTKKPKVHKIAHVFKILKGLNATDTNDSDEVDSDEDDSDEDEDTLPKRKLNIEQDKAFLSSKMIDIHQIKWNQRAGIQFIFNYPFFSEFIAIVWCVMCLIYQTSIKKLWGVPKPWRIVLPSMVIFALMTTASLAYVIMANKYLKALCTDLRIELTDATLISCGQAMSALRPVVRQHALSYDAYLNLFRSSYIIGFILWSIAFIVMLLRYFLAIDFKLIDIAPPMISKKPKVETVYQRAEQNTNMLHVDEQRKSDEDYQSAKSHLSEVAVPLLNTQQPKSNTAIES